MATYRVLYWQEIPSQIEARDDHGDVNLPLPPKFMERIDAAAAERGLTDSDSYLEHWQWSEDAERDGTAADVAAALLAELEANADW